MSNPIGISYNTGVDKSQKDTYLESRKKVIDLTSVATGGHPKCPNCYDLNAGLLVRRIYDDADKRSYLCCGKCNFKQQMEYQPQSVIAPPPSDINSAYSDYGAKTSDSELGPLICSQPRRGGPTRQRIEMLQQMSKKKSYGSRQDRHLPTGGHITSESNYVYDSDTRSWERTE